jgi:DNA-binding transcriptional LysR family regulator
MDLQDLRSFQALADELSFTAAARRLHVSQPSLSKRLQRLEGRLGVTLVERTTTTVALTPAGAWLLSRATPLLEEWQRVADQASLLAAGAPVTGLPEPTASLRLAVYSPYEGDLQEHLSTALPHHGVAVSVADPALALARLDADDGVDAALVHDLPGLLAFPAVRSAHVATVVVEPLWVLLGRRHRLAERDELSVEEVVAQGLPWIVSPSGHPVRRWEQAFLLGRAPRAELREAVEGSLVEIARGRAVALSSPLNTPNELLALRPLTPPVSWHHYLAWQPHRVPGSVASELVAALRGFHRQRAQRNPRYWRWICDRPGRFPGIGPEAPGAAAAPAALGS